MEKLHTGVPLGVWLISGSYTAQDHPEAAVMRHPARLARRPAHDHAYARFARSIVSFR